MEYAQNITKKSRSQSAKQHTQTPTSASSPIFQRMENNTGLPDNLKAGIENLSGYSMDDVNVHYNSNKPAGLQAHAYAQGTDIHLGPGQERHLPHEAWHVVQQKQGRVRPTMQLKGKVNVNDDSGLEKEADVMGGKALQMNAVNTNADKRLEKEVDMMGIKALQGPSSPPSNQPIQAIGWEEVWALAGELGISLPMLYTAISILGIAVAYALLTKNKNNKDQARKTISNVVEKNKNTTPTFIEPSNLQELQDCIDKKQYPSDLPTLGNKKDWVRRTANKLGLKAKIDNLLARVDRVEGVQYAQQQDYPTQSCSGSGVQVNTTPKVKVKTKGVGNPQQAIIALPPVPVFAFNDPTTWDIQPIQTCHHFPGMGGLGIPLNYQQALSTGMLTNNSTAVGAAVDTNYHAHANGGGSGFAFRYIRNPGTSVVTPTIYDFANGRQGNIYQWRHHAALNTAPAFP